MNSHNLQIQIMAMAVMVRAKGMEADNLCRTFNNEQPCYNDTDFESLACELDGLAQKIVVS